MKLKDLFNIIIKVFGLFMAKDILASLPYILSPLIALGNGETHEGVVPQLLFSLVILAVYCTVTYLLLFRTGSIVSALKLEPEFMEEKLTFTISSKNIITISLIVLSGYILIEEIPNFCKNLYTYYELSQDRFSGGKPSIANLLVSGVKILTVSLIIGERKNIIQFILREKPVQEEE